MHTKGPQWKGRPAGSGCGNSSSSNSSGSSVPWTEPVAGRDSLSLVSSPLFCLLLPELTHSLGLMTAEGKDE